MPLPAQIAWICPICGYIHYGAEPPEECPVCGAACELFEEYLENPAPSAEPVSEWRCKECGFIHYGPNPPDFCPVCGYPANQFEPMKPRKRSFTEPSLAQKVVIIGAGIAGVSAAEATRKTDPSSEVVLISKENHLPYYRLNLTRYLAGEITAEKLILHPAEWYIENKIELRTATEATAIDLQKKEVTLQDGKTISFDILILALGASPFVPPFAGANKVNVTTLRTLEDADFILSACQPGAKFVCIGGGLLGLETAGALARRGVDVTVLENQSWLMPRQLNETAARLFQENISALGIHLITGVKVKEITGLDKVTGVLLDDGTLLPADVVVISAGVRPNTELVRKAGIQTNQGIIVDAEMKTGNPAVFAAGDAAEFTGIVYGTWGPSQGQGAIAGMNASGRRADFAAIPRSNTLKVLGTNLFSIGPVNPSPEGSILREDRQGSHYTGLVFLHNRLIAAILLEDISLSAAVKKVVEEKIALPEDLIIQPDMKSLIEFIKKSAVD
jgi:nitrite reductase (NADH) large subunit